MITEIDILWITAGPGCDGDTIAMTAATQPSLEDVLGGFLPGLPKVRETRVVSVDECYRLAGLVRMHHAGTAGGALGDGARRCFDELRDEVAGSRAS